MLAGMWNGFAGLIGILLVVLRASDAFGQAGSLGQWGARFDWPNVAIHTHLLPNGKVMFWSRREWDANNPTEGLDPRDSTPRIWDPQTNTFTSLPRPGFNLFCAGHAFLGDGRLLVAGGHIRDGDGEPHATIYDPDQNTWTRIDDMNRGRWYPTLVTLADGQSVVVSSGSENGQMNDVQQIGKNGHWSSIVNFGGLPYYPRMHLAPDGRVFMSGPLNLTQFLDTSGAGQWTPVGRRNPQDNDNGLQEYGCSVMYDVGKVLYVGGGVPPTNGAVTINLQAPNPTWAPTGSMRFRRRQHNATLLPDGTVLVNGGTQGQGGPQNGFNDLTPGQPIRAAELWDPVTGQWTVLAEEQVDRCYHSTAILLPDATVLSAGGGEFRPDGNIPNDLRDSHRDGQIFSPPYLFRGARPTITSAPTDVTYGQVFNVGTAQPAEIQRATFVRLSSVTHSFNSGQRINFLQFTSDGTQLQVTAPAGPNTCPPGYYLLFILNQQGVPSIAKTIRIHNP
ncbi:MAG: galactose oxidase-like domain-containing protein [Chthoniobacter sp.]